MNRRGQTPGFLIYFLPLLLFLQRIKVFEINLKPAST